MSLFFEEDNFERLSPIAKSCNDLEVPIDNLCFGESLFASLLISSSEFSEFEKS